jgi:small subunit ribosomal protein S20
VANLSSAEKRNRQNERNRRRNRAQKSRVKTETRKLTDALQSGALDAARGQLIRVTKLLDQTAAKGVMHKNTAARKKSRLARRLNQAAGAGKAT